MTVALLLLAHHSFSQAPNPARELVNPFIGTGGHGHTFPGACVPNGMVQLSLDTRPDGYMDWDGCGGYHYSDSVIYGFSHTHLSGTGVADLCDVLLMPMSGKYSLDPNIYRSQFSKQTEQANAGYYTVHLEGPDVRTELTATARVGVHRYAFPKGQEQYIIADLLHRDKVLDSEIRLTSDTEVVGSRRSSSWARDQQLYFCIRFSKPVQLIKEGAGEWTNTALGGKQAPLKVPSKEKAAWYFGPNDGTELIVKVGISSVSIEGARANLEAEVPHWDFDKVRAEAEAAWNAKLNKIQVQGGTKEQQRIFYTALYHTYVAPCLFNDVDGKYRGMDGQVHRADHNVYTVFSLWDTFRALHPLMTILEPDMTSDWIKTFLLHYQRGGRLPVWELWGNETDCMIGYHSASVIADAYLKGIRGFDADLALKAMVASANQDHFGLEAYRRRGFISSEDEPESVSRTLEYAYDDACIAYMASRMSRQDTAEAFFRRAENWTNLFDPATGFFRARRNGGFIEPFDPYEVNFHFTEANAWQYSLFVPQNIERLVALHGGSRGLEKHLDSLFSARTETTGRDQSDITGLIGQYAHGNEPSHHMAYLYNHVDRPDKTRALVKRILDEQYHDAPDGLSGNEDCGQMSAWYVLSALGIYPISPGINDRYELGHPLFDKAVVTLHGGKTWTTTVDLAGTMVPIVPKDTVFMKGGIPDHVEHSLLKQGGELVFNAQRIPYRTYTPRFLSVLDGAYIPEHKERPGAPIIAAASATFTDQLEVTVSGRGTCSLTDASGTRTCPMNAPFTITTTSTIEVVWSDHFAPVTALYTRFDGSRTVSLESTYASQYAAGGDQALVDGLRGGKDFRTGEWQGFHGQDVLATVDLGGVKQVKRIGLGVLQDQRSWIWFPAEVTFAWSMNGRQWSSRTVESNADRKADGGQTAEMWTEVINKKARYIKIMAKNAGPCPDWHPGKGGATWIFLDEILIETGDTPTIR